ncbi:nitrogenase molybdenum-iron protein beta chain [bacterium BMS3Abin12]|nr:nitrogenase molybdenum-iron protein beta chain [bacterium BMS3Abin12]
MAELLKRKKALSVSPLKVGQPVGAALAFLGIRRAIPMLHGSQGCTAFGKTFLVRHFREPIPLQTTAMDQVSSVMGADDNLVEGLRTLCEKARPALIGLPTTGLVEAQGADLQGAVRCFRERHPEYASVPIVPVNTPDFAGCMESGYGAAVHAVIDCLVAPAMKAGTRPGRRHRQVNVLAGAALTPGDVEALKVLLEGFGLRPVVVPDLADSLDGHLGEDPFSPVSTGGTPVSELAALGEAAATLVVGASLYKAADLLRERTGVPDYRFDHLMGLDAVDDLVAALGDISGAPVPASVQRRRAQLLDAMLDTHFMLGRARIAVAADPDVLNGFDGLLRGMGAELVAAVAPVRTPVLERVSATHVQIGDLEDLEHAARANGARLLIGSSHAAESARRLGVPLLRAGFPQHDRVGGYQRTWIGYQGARQALFDLANLLLMQDDHEIEPYHSIYAQKSG